MLRESLPGCWREGPSNLQGLEPRLTAVRGEGWGGEATGLRKKTLTDTGDSVVITRDREEGREGRVKGDEWWWKEAWLRVVNTQFNMQMMCCRIAHLK